MKNKKGEGSAVLTTVIWLILALLAAGVITWLFIITGLSEKIGPIMMNALDSVGKQFTQAWAGIGGPQMGMGTTTGGPGEDAVDTEGSVSYTNVPYEERRQFLSEVIDGGFWLEVYKEGTRVDMRIFSDSDSKIPVACSGDYTKGWFFKTGDENCCTLPPRSAGLVVSEAVLEGWKKLENLCIRVTKITDTGVDFSGMEKYHAPGALLLSGKTYSLMKGEKYKLKTNRNTYEIKYFKDSISNVQLVIFKLGTEKRLDCESWASPNLKLLADGTVNCCEDLRDICAKLIRQDPETNVIEIKVCEMKRC